MKPRRYQLRKEAAGVALHHPWIFRDHLSSAATVFADGDWLRLVDGDNRTIAYGIYEATGAIAIRIVRRGHAPPDAAWLRAQLAAAIERRAALAAHTDALRLVHGESDGLPAVVVDRFGDTLVVSSYATGADLLARYIAHALGTDTPRRTDAPRTTDTPRTKGAPGTTNVVGAARGVLIRPARLRQVAGEPARVLRGGPPGVVKIVEDGVEFAVDLTGGQKTGTYLDLRGLRRAVREAPIGGKRVLNLFAYSGMLGRVAERAGAERIVQVDSSERALGFAAAHHVDDAAKHDFVVADVFEWLPALAADAQFDLVIVDPPAMTTKAAQIPKVLAGYRKLYRAAAGHVAPGGVLAAACCTSRIERAVFHRTVGEALGPKFSMGREIPPEPDHPVGFPQADYLKIGWWICGQLPVDIASLR